MFFPRAQQGLWLCCIWCWTNAKSTRFVLMGLQMNLYFFLFLYTVTDNFFLCWAACYFTCTLKEKDFAMEIGTLIVRILFSTKLIEPKIIRFLPWTRITKCYSAFLTLQNLQSTWLLGLHKPYVFLSPGAEMACLQFLSTWTIR